MAVVTMRQMLEAGVHFGHQTRRWNPKMKRFIFGERNGIYIIDLQQTLSRDRDRVHVRPRPRRRRRHDAVRRHQEAGPGPGAAATPRSAACRTSTSAGSAACSPTSRRSPSASRKMQEYERMRASGEFDAMPKKEALLLEPRAREAPAQPRRHRATWSKRPDAVFVLDTKKEHIAVTEANKLGIPVVAVVDTNFDPDVDPVPDPRQRRRHPRQRADVPRDRRRRRGGPLHRLQAGRSAAPSRTPSASPSARRGGRASPPARPRPARQAASARRPSARPASPPAQQPAAAPRRPPTRPPVAEAAVDEPAVERGRGRRALPAPRPRPRPRPSHADAPTEAPQRDEPRPTSRPPPTKPDRRSADLTHRRTNRSTDDGVHRQGRPGAAPGHRRRDDGLQEGARGDRRRHRGRQAVAPREGPRRQRQARRPREHPGRRRPRRRRSASAAIVELKCETDFVAGSEQFKAEAETLADLVAAKGEDAVAERATELDDLKIMLKENIELGEVVRFEAAAGQRARHYLHIQGGRGVNGVLVELAGGDARAGPRRRRAHRLRPPEVPAPRRGARPTWSTPSATTLETITRNEGKPEAAMPKIVEGRLNGFFKDVVPARAALRQGRQAVDRAAARRRRRSSASPRSRSAEPQMSGELSTDGAATPLEADRLQAVG